MYLSDEEIRQVEATASKQQLNDSVRTYLAKAYGTLALTCCACACGVQANSVVSFNPTLVAVVMCLLMAMVCASSTRGFCSVSRGTRVAYVVVFGFLQGLVLGDVIADALAVDPRMIMASVCIVMVVFLSFTLAVLFSDRPATIYTGSTALAIQVCLIAQAATGVYVENQMLACAFLCFFCANLAHDTEQLVTRCRNGDQDFVRGALQLFLDGILIFVRVLNILRTQGNKRRRHTSRFSNKYL
jgi:FtsH-binding integral membrane protein